MPRYFFGIYHIFKLTRHIIHCRFLSSPEVYRYTSCFAFSNIIIVIIHSWYFVLIIIPKIFSTFFDIYCFIFNAFTKALVIRVYFIPINVVKIYVFNLFKGYFWFAFRFDFYNLFFVFNNYRRTSTTKKASTKN